MILTDALVRKAADAQWPGPSATGQRIARTILRAVLPDILEAAANVADEECARVLAKQTLYPRSNMDDEVNKHLRMIAVLLPDISAAIRALGEG